MQFKLELTKRPRVIINYLLSAPIMYSGIFVLLVMDIFFEIYHRSCFWLYGIPYVKRRDYIRLDRQKLSYLNWWEKLNCVYCGYANGLAAYVVEIIARTEKYWCGIKHKKYKGFISPPHHKDFLKYGDVRGYEKFIKGGKSK